MPPPAPGQRPLYVVRGGEGPVKVVTDCECVATWAGDELVVRFCAHHRVVAMSTELRYSYAGPPTLGEPPPIGRPNYGDN